MLHRRNELSPRVIHSKARKERFSALVGPGWPWTHLGCLLRRLQPAVARTRRRRRRRGSRHSGAPQRRVRRVQLRPACQILPLPTPATDFKLQSNLVWDLIKPISNFCFQFKQNKTKKILKLTTRSAYTVDLYPNPTAPLYPNSPVGKTGSAKPHLLPAV
jgi:hypothetical protein